MTSFLLPALILQIVEPSSQWTGFRGTGDSHTSARNLPLTWSDRHNLAWKVATPGFGQSTPVVWKGRIYLTAVEDLKKEKLHVLSLDLESGRELWRRTYESSRPQETGDRVARAASKPSVDADGLYALLTAATCSHSLTVALQELQRRTLSAAERPRLRQFDAPVGRYALRVCKPLR